MAFFYTTELQGVCHSYEDNGKKGKEIYKQQTLSTAATTTAAGPQGTLSWECRHLHNALKKEYIHLVFNASEGKESLTFLLLTTKKKKNVEKPERNLNVIFILGHSEMSGLIYRCAEALFVCRGSDRWSLLILLLSLYGYDRYNPTFVSEFSTNLGRAPADFVVLLFFVFKHSNMIFLSMTNKLIKSQWF